MKIFFAFVLLFGVASASAQLFPQIPKIKAGLGPLHVAFGDDSKEMKEIPSSEGPSSTTELPKPMDDCVCPNGTTSNTHTLDEIWDRQNEMIEMQRKTWEQVMRIADTIYAIQYGRRVIDEVVDNNQ